MRDLIQSTDARKPRLLDLFCCAGGAAMGYHRAGFEVVGVDINPQPRYPFQFLQGDATAADLNGFDAVHASPPCQRHSDLAKRNGNGHTWPCFIEPIREKLRVSGLPYVIENVEGAPLINPTMLCGTMFGLRVIRHRLFETNFPLAVPPHGKHLLVYTMDKRKPHYGKLNEWTSPVQVTGGGNCSKAAAADAMGIDWATKNELNEAIPPAYSEWIGRQLLAWML
ncbi:MAG: DNA cytosine methyltransferase [Massilia sp.]